MSTWKEKTMAHWGLINQLAKRRFANATLAEEAALSVINGLERNDWQRLKQFKGTSSFQTFLSSITFRLLEDFSRKKFGRHRPPLWIRKLGGIWILLYTFLCMERLRIVEAVECVIDRTQALKRKEVEEAAQRIKEEITDCGAHQNLEISLDDETIADGQGDGLCAAQEKLEDEERNLFYAALFNLYLEPSNQKDFNHFTTQISKTTISLTSEERLLLQLCYRDGLTPTEAGKMLGLNRHQVHGRVRRLLARLRKDFKKTGVDKDLKMLLKK